AELAASRLGDLGPLWSGLSDIRSLVLRAGLLELGAMAARSLRELSITSFALDPAVLAALARAELPALSRLALRVSGSPLDPDGVAAVLASAHGQRVGELALIGTDATGELWRAIADSARARHLRRLDLSGGTLSDRDVGEVLSQAVLFENLDELDVSGNTLSEPAARALVQDIGDLGIAVVADEQRPLIDDRLAMTEQQIRRFAPDDRSLALARALARPDRWPELGRTEAVVWGRCRGSQLYSTYVDMAAGESLCTCPSMKYPCKHAIALVMLVQAHPIPDAPLPEGFTASGEGGPLAPF
ncbi:MAG: SWIM zinc finger family protein, partial [Myxococcota bacterium]